MKEFKNRPHFHTFFFNEKHHSQIEIGLIPQLFTKIMAPALGHAYNRECPQYLVMLAFFYFSQPNLFKKESLDCHHSLVQYNLSPFYRPFCYHYSPSPNSLSAISGQEFSSGGSGGVSIRQINRFSTGLEYDM